MGPAWSQSNSHHRLLGCSSGHLPAKVWNGSGASTRCYQLREMWCGDGFKGAFRASERSLTGAVRNSYGRGRLLREKQC